MEKQRLKNGIMLLVDPVPGSEVASIGLWLDRGSRDENRGEHGYTHFTEHMLFKGTAKRSPLDIALEIDGMGAEINGSTSHEHTCFYINTAGVHLRKAVEILADMYGGSLFDLSEFEKEKLVILGEIGMSFDDPEDYVNQMFSRIIWPGHGLGAPVMGEEADVRNTTLEKLRAFYQKNYTTDRLILSAAGSVDRDLLAGAAEACFGNRPGLPPGDPSEKMSPEGDRGRQKPIPGNGGRSEFREIEHVYLVCGTEGYGFRDGRRYPLILLNMVLGGSFSSRLFQRIREDRGLCYAISSSLSSFTDTGEFTIGFSTLPGNLRAVLDELNVQIRGVREYGIGEEDLELSKKRFHGNYVLARENVEWKMTRMALEEMAFGRIFPYDEVLHKINRVTADDTAEVAADILRADRFCLASLGPEEHRRVLEDWIFDFS